MFAPRNDESLEGGPLQLGYADGRTIEYAKGISMHSRTEMVYRLTSPYRRLQAVVGIDNRLRPAGNVVVTIFNDAQPIWQETISGKQDPIDLDLDIQGVQRLRILVDFGNDLDIADHLNMCDARIVK
jgi:hypothetical protein